MMTLHHDPHDEQILDLRQRIRQEMRETAGLRETSDRLDGRIARELSEMDDHLKQIRWQYQRGEDGNDGAE